MSIIINFLVSNSILNLKVYIIFGILLSLPLGLASSTNAQNLQKKIHSNALEEVLKLAHITSNEMEHTRFVPSSMYYQGNEINPAQALYLFAYTISEIDKKNDVAHISIPDLEIPENFYPSIELDDQLYEKGLERKHYLDFTNELLNTLYSRNSTPNKFSADGKAVRFAESLHFTASILRFYKFFGYLPPFQEIYIVSPQGLVPWDVPNKPRYLSMHSNYTYFPNQSRYNFFSTGKYSFFKLAKRVSNSNSILNAAENIHRYIIREWNFAGYAIYTPTFGLPNSAEEQFTSPYKNSAHHSVKLNGLTRSLGIPSFAKTILDVNTNRLLASDVHCVFGLPPYDCSFITPEDGLSERNIFPNQSDKLVQNIKSIMTNSGQKVSQQEHLLTWINSSDILEYGSQYVIDNLISSGFTGVIVSVKNETGFIYFNSISSNKSNYYIKTNKVDVLTSFAKKASENGLNVYAGFSVLADRLVLKSGPKDWKQMNFSNPDPSNPYPNMSISPCVSAYRNRNVSLLKELASQPNLAGIVLSHLYWDTSTDHPENYLGGNPECKKYYGDQDWRQKLLRNYADTLKNAIMSINPSLEMWIATYPVFPSKYLHLDGHENKLMLAEIADGLIIPFSNNYWLLDKTDAFPNELHRKDTTLHNPNPYSLKENLTPYTALDIPIIPSITITDEWVYPSLFYSGFAGFTANIGARGISLHSAASMNGDFGPAFKRTQYQTIKNIDFNQTYQITTSTNSTSNNYLPTQHLLFDNYPNPFNPTTTISFELSTNTPVQLFVFDIMGKKLKTLVDESKSQGSYSIQFDATEFASGIYFYQLITDQRSVVKKMLLVK